MDTANAILALLADLQRQIEALRAENAELRAAACHPNCEQHGRSPVEGVRCDGSGLHA